MKAVVMRQNELLVEELANPEPGQGEVLVKTLACGICGSDLHMFQHCDHVLDTFKHGGIPISFNPDQGVVFGHEYCAEILDHGPGSPKTLKAGTRVCAIPHMITPTSFHHVGLSNRYPGGYGEQMVLAERLLVPVPGDLPSDIAALTEPLAIAVHAVGRAQLQGDEVPVVIGCGPIGLAVIMALKARGIGPVVASDFSAKRRALAEKLGADVVVNPAERSPYATWAELAAPGTDPRISAAVLGTEAQRPCVVFECVGIKGLIQQILRDAPARSRVVVVGVCMESDSFEPIFAIRKEVNLNFAFGYTEEEFSRTLHDLADGRLDGAAMITARIGMDGVAEAFDTLKTPEDHAKIMITFD
ncbi:zinc-binding dehydrogenase [Pseudomonas jinjuensis]|uniref:Threonine dehydrogenase n=1 Tax=Pseudomonas jinjuensis TaxID=198616 RepID=A0A1H0D8L9_9PSED|nr:zinc-binding dehydrogenase [Pseudomonas jinjuensis]SDN66419.1 Threonine dehydrogenase [Pseudomonas jinjuensis]